MTNESISHDWMRAILVFTATIAMIVFNGFAALGYINSVTPGVISAKYPTILTPAGYAFSIWSIIYLGLAAFSVFQAFRSNLARFRPVRTLYIASCLLNCAWIYFWHYEQIAICFVVILLLLGTLLLMHMKLSGCGNTAETWLMQAPFGLYFGWVTAASLVTFTVFLKYLEVEAASSSILASALVLTAAVCAIIVRVRLRNFFYPLAVAWALTAIAVKQSGDTIIVVSTAVGVVICLVTTGSLVVNLRDSTSE
jgi:hypothetical protein